MRWRSAPPEPRGVTVYTLVAAEFYASADSWTLDEKESLHVLDVQGRQVATHIHGSWVRIEVGAPPEQPINPQEGS